MCGWHDLFNRRLRKTSVGSWMVPDALPALANLWHTGGCQAKTRNRWACGEVLEVHPEGREMLAVDWWAQSRRIRADSSARHDDKGASVCVRVARWTDTYRNDARSSVPEQVVCQSRAPGACDLTGKHQTSLGNYHSLQERASFRRAEHLLQAKRTQAVSRMYRRLSTAVSAEETREGIGSAAA